MAFPFSVTIDGMPATEIAKHSPIVYETWADGGCGSLTFDFAMSPKQTHHLIYPGAVVEAAIGMRRVFSGRLFEYERTTGALTAYGHASHARKLPALTSGGTSTRDVGVAANTARGWGWLGMDPASANGGTVTGDDTGPVTLGELLDQWAEEAGQRWGVNAQRIFFRRGDPTTPSLWLNPDIAALGQTDEDVASHLAARFINTGGTISSTHRPDSTTLVTSMPTIDLTERGKLTLAQANAILDGILTRNGTRYAWTSGMTVHRSQMHVNGSEPFLPTITAGNTMVGLYGIPAASFAGTNQTAVIGKTRFDAASPDVIYLEPVSTAPRNYADIQAAS